MDLFVIIERMFWSVLGLMAFVYVTRLILAKPTPPPTPEAFARILEESERRRESQIHVIRRVIALLRYRLDEKGSVTLLPDGDSFRACLEQMPELCTSTYDTYGMSMDHVRMNVRAILLAAVNEETSVNAVAWVAIPDLLVDMRTKLIQKAHVPYRPELVQAPKAEAPSKKTRGRRRDHKKRYT